MAWMFAATEQDMTVGMHLHYHYVPPLMPPVPFYPHPAIGFIQDKLCTSVKADNRKAAKTGAKTKVLLPPHMPWIGPITHGTGKEGTGIQQIWMGAGIGVHPFGGIGFVVLEGKPAAGMLSNCLGCWCVAPGFDMMLPFIGLDFVMIPTRGVSVLYGPAPLALDLFVLLLSLLRDLFDWILSKVPDGFWKDVLEDAFDSIMEGAEVFCDAIEHGASPMEALKAGAAAAAYTFVDKSINRAVDFAAGKLTALGGKALDGVFGKAGGALGKTGLPEWAKKGADSLLDKGKDFLKDKMKDEIKDLSGKAKEGLFGLADKGTGGFLSQGKEAVENKDSHFGKAEAPNPLGFITDPLEKVADASNKSANAKYDAWKEQDGKSKEAKGKADAANKVLNDPKASAEDKKKAQEAYNDAKKDQAAAEKAKAKTAQEMKVDADHLAEDAAKKTAGAIVEKGKDGVKDEVKKELGVDKDSLAGKAIDKVLDKGMDKAADKLKEGASDKKKADMKAWEDEQKKKDGIEPPKDDRPKEKPLSPDQQKKQADKALEDRNKKDAAKDAKDDAQGKDQEQKKQDVQNAKEQQKQAEEQKKADAEKKQQEKNAAVKKSLEDQAARDEAMAKQREEWIKNNKADAQKHDEEIKKLEQQKAKAKSDADKKKLDQQIEDHQDAKKSLDAAVERQKLEKEHLEQRAKETKRAANGDGYVEARDGDTEPVVRPITDGMSDDDKKKWNEHYGVEDAVAKKLSKPRK